ncbi:phytyl ester synthase 2, chloroplastic-like [Cornus florida]|uniref:phytyl ester synthase 2, chloroplastic-like n=1 Tax=Cornus florida TaxID=4283 RepID=UPI002897851F|nr:phytyl ester synthase 2, chloroplastic-like [Cornus florida]
MAASSAFVVGGGSSAIFGREISRDSGTLKLKTHLVVKSSATTRRSVELSEQQRRERRLGSEAETARKLDEESESESESESRWKEVEAEVGHGLSLKDYFEQSTDLMKSDGGPPRWFSPLECGSRLDKSPLLLFLPGVDGLGLGLVLHHQRLGKLFDIWCLHIPIMDRTPFADLVNLVEKTVRSEYYLSPNRPIYLVGESVGGCLALTVAARNPGIDLVLILSNPATCFSKSQLQPFLPFLEFMPVQLHHGVPYMLSLLTGLPLRMAMATWEKGLPPEQTVGELSQGVIALSSFLSVLADVLAGETLLWKLQMLKSASAYTNSRLHAVKAQTLILSSGKDQLLPSEEEGERLCRILPKCQIRKFSDQGHALLLEDGVDLVTIIKGASYYRRARCLDYASDYIPPSPSEFKKIYESIRWMEAATHPVMLSTLENGKIVKGLAGIPSEGPILFVGYHMLLGIELIPLVSRLWAERNILLRGLAHPMMFVKMGDGSPLDISTFDILRIMGAVPVSGTNFYRLLSSKSHVLLYPGGMREALHRKGEEYKLFWPEQSEFVRMAARFGAKIIPFGAVGEDDVCQVVFDYDDQMKIPHLRAEIEERTNQFVRLRTDIDGEVANQAQHLPYLLPKLPGRFYYLFGKPIETAGRKQELRNREGAHKLYLEVQSEVEKCLAYLKEKRESDPYRNIIPRLIYQSANGFDSEVPTFEL